MKTDAQKTGPQVVTVENIQPAKKAGFSSLRLRSIEAGVKDITSVLLGGKAFDRHTVGFQTISDEQLKELGIVIGSEIGKVTGKDVRLTVTELTEAQYNALPEDRESGKGWMCKKAFQPKLIPADASKNRAEDVMITSGGSQVYRTTRLTDADEVDTLLKSDTVLSIVEENESAGKMAA